MRKLLLVATIAFVSAVNSHAAAIVINAFDNLLADSPAFLATWIDGSDDQYVQDTGFVAIQPVGAGDPQDDGSFGIAPGSWSSGFDLTSSGTNTNISLLARFDAGNASTGISILFTDINFSSASYTFTGFTSSFTSVAVNMSSFSAAIDWTAITDYAVGGGASTPENAFRASISEISATAIPEPTTWALFATGLATAMAFRPRRRQS